MLVLRFVFPTPPGGGVRRFVKPLRRLSALGGDKSAPSAAVITTMPLFLAFVEGQHVRSQYSCTRTQIPGRPIGGFLPGPGHRPPVKRSIYYRSTAALRRRCAAVSNQK